MREGFMREKNGSFYGVSILRGKVEFMKKVLVTFWGPEILLHAIYRTTLDLRYTTTIIVITYMIRPVIEWFVTKENGWMSPIFV